MATWKGLTHHERLCWIRHGRDIGLSGSGMAAPLGTSRSAIIGYWSRHADAIARISSQEAAERVSAIGKGMTPADPPRSLSGQPSRQKGLTKSDQRIRARKRPSKPEPVQAVQVVEVVETEPAPPILFVPPIKPPQPETQGQVRLVDAAFGQCRYLTCKDPCAVPYSEHFICAAPVVPGRSWCRDHLSKVMAPDQQAARKRQAQMGALIGVKR